MGNWIPDMFSPKTAYGGSGCSHKECPSNWRISQGQPTVQVHYKVDGLNPSVVHEECLGGFLRSNQQQTEDHPIKNFTFHNTYGWNDNK